MSKIQASVDPYGGSFSVENIEQILPSVTKFVSQIIPNFIKEGDMFFADKIKHWRILNQIKLLISVKEMIDKSKLQINPIHLKLLQPILDNASIEDDEQIGQKYANMLANAITSQKNVRFSYPEILKQLTDIEVLILDLVFNEFALAKKFDRVKLQTFLNDLGKNIDDKNMVIMIENLYRINLLQPPSSTGMNWGQDELVVRTTNYFEMTQLGHDFVSCCKFESSVTN